MCSVDGFTGSAPFTIEEYTSFNKERGPDGSNHYSDDQISIGHNLLAIKPNTSPQPVIDERTGNVFAYNGELYDLKENDTETLFNLIQDNQWKTIYSELNGQWAFAYYDRAREKVILGRDHFGVKPMFYMELNYELYFSSTIKPLMAVLNLFQYGVELDEVTTERYHLRSRFLTGVHTPFKYIKKLAPGEVKVWDNRKKQFQQSKTHWNEKFWDLTPNYGWTVDELRELTQKAFKNTAQADPHVTLSLSGGLDSSLIAGICHKQLDSVTSTKFVRSKTVQPDNPRMFDEYSMAKRTAELLELKLNTAEVRATDVEECIMFPSFDKNRLMPRLANVRRAAKAGAKIMLNGDGSDEMLTGYNGDHLMADGQDYPYRHGNSYQNLAGRAKFLMKDIEMICNKRCMKRDHLNNFLFERTLINCDGYNLVSDYLCGMYGMESRPPFQYQELAKFLLNIPGAMKYHSPNPEYRPGNYKGILRDNFTDFIPDEVLSRKLKTGFASPWNSRGDRKNRELGQNQLNEIINQSEQLSFKEE